MADKFQVRDLTDGIFGLLGGQNSAQEPILLEKSQAHSLVNATVRGAFLKQRPKFRNIPIDFDGDEDLEFVINNGRWQGGTYYKPDVGPETLVAQIEGRLFQFTPSVTTAVVREISIPGDPNPADIPLAWLWQSENYVIVNNGVSDPIFFDGNTSRRSNRGAVLVTIQTALPFTAPAVGDSVTVTLVSPYTGPINYPITICGATYTVPSVMPAGGYPALLTNVDGEDGEIIPDGSGILTQSIPDTPPLGTVFQTGGVIVPSSATQNSGNLAYVILNPFDQEQLTDSGGYVYFRTDIGNLVRFILIPVADSGGFSRFNIKEAP